MSLENGCGWGWKIKVGHMVVVVAALVALKITQENRAISDYVSNSDGHDLTSDLISDCHCELQTCVLPTK